MGFAPASQILSEHHYSRSIPDHVDKFVAIEGGTVY
jgi:hypothetical protein